MNIKVYASLVLCNAILVSITFVVLNNCVSEMEVVVGKSRRQFENLIKKAEIEKKKPEIEAVPNKIMLNEIDDQRLKCSNPPGPLEFLKVLKHSDKDDQNLKYLTEIQRPRAHVTSHQDSLYKNNQNYANEKAITYWHENSHNNVICYGLHLQDHRSIVIDKPGRYYIYSQLKFNCSGNDKATHHRHVTYYKRENSPYRHVLLENNYFLGGNTEGQKCSKVSHHGAVVKLEKGEEVFVTAQTGPRSHLIANKDRDSFFGAIMVS